MQPLVSVICTTYNHEKYISQALESFLMQNVDFEFEIIIHDDASTDNTASIIKSYENKFPEILSPIYQSENQASKERGRVTRIAFGAARGKYLALCEGDDYWTDPYKLQKQVDFLERSSEYAICAHETLIKFEHKTQIEDMLFSDFKHNAFRNNYKQIYSLKDILKGNIFHLSSAMVRNRIKQFPDFIKNISTGDMVLFPLYAEHGEIFVMNDVMSVYRNNYASVTNTSLHFTNKINYAKNKIFMYEKLHEYFQGNFEKILYPLISKNYVSLWSEYFWTSKFKDANRVLKLAWFYDKTCIFEMIKKLLEKLNIVIVRYYYFIRKKIRNSLKFIYLLLAKQLF